MVSESVPVDIYDSDHAYVTVFIVSAGRNGRVWTRHCVVYCAEVYYIMIYVTALSPSLSGKWCNQKVLPVSVFIVIPFRINVS